MSTFENVTEEKMRRLSKFSLEEIFLYLINTGRVYNKISLSRQIRKETRKVAAPSGYREPFEHEIFMERLESNLIEVLKNKDFDSFQQLYTNNQEDLANIIYSGHFECL